MMLRVQVDRVLEIDYASKGSKAKATLYGFFKNGDFLVSLYNTMVTKEWVCPGRPPLSLCAFLRPDSHVWTCGVFGRCPTDIRTKITDVRRAPAIMCLPSYRGRQAVGPAAGHACARLLILRSVLACVYAQVLDVCMEVWQWRDMTCKTLVEGGGMQDLQECARALGEDTISTWQQQNKMTTIVNNILSGLNR